MWLADRLWVRANSKKPAEPGHSPTPDSARTHTLSNKDIIYTYQIKIKKNPAGNSRKVAAIDRCVTQMLNVSKACLGKDFKVTRFKSSNVHKHLRVFALSGQATAVRSVT